MRDARYCVLQLSVIPFMTAKSAAMNGAPAISPGGRIAEISVDCRWRRAGFDCALLGRIVDREPHGDSFSIRHADREYNGLRDYRILHDIPGQAWGTECGLAVPGAGGVYRRVQHLFYV